MKFRDKKSFGKGESRDKEGGKGIRTENYNQVRLKLQGDRLMERSTNSCYVQRSISTTAWSTLTTFSPVLVASSVENWGILQGTVLRKRKTTHSLFTGDKETATESETFFSGMALGDLNVENGAC